MEKVGINQNIDFFRTYYKRTVCEVTREIFDFITEEKNVIGDRIYNKILGLLEEQMIMQKKMDMRLKHHYHDNYEKEIYKDNNNTDNKIKKRTALFEKLNNIKDRNEAL